MSFYLPLGKPELQRLAEDPRNCARDLADKVAEKVYEDLIHRDWGRVESLTYGEEIGACIEVRIPDRTGTGWGQEESPAIDAKILEIRDDKTNISAVAFVLNPASANEHAQAILGRVGICSVPMIGMLKLSDSRFCPHHSAWSNPTMQKAHRYLQEHWTAVEPVQVLDVRVIDGRRALPAEPDHLNPVEHKAAFPGVG